MKNDFRYFDIKLDNEVPYHIKYVLGDRGMSALEREVVKKVLQGSEGPKFSFDYKDHRVSVEVNKADYTTNYFDIVITDFFE